MIIYKNVMYKCFSIRVQNLLVLFDGYEYERENDCLWLFKNSECMGVIDSESCTCSITKIITRLERLGVVNYGIPRTRKQKEDAPQMGAESLLERGKA